MLAMQQGLRRIYRNPFVFVELAIGYEAATG
jgi:hypothetical protein